MASSKGKEKVIEGNSGKRKLHGGADDSAGVRKRRNRAVLQLFEDSAFEVDGDSSDDEDDFDVNDFLEDESFNDVKVNNEPVKVPLVPFIKEEEMDDAELERMVEERYGQGSSFVRYADDAYDNMEAVDRDEYPPFSVDPTLWKVKCMVGREKHSVVCLMQKYVDLKTLGTKLQIISAFSLDHVKGFIYIEAASQQNLYEACKGLSTIYVSRVTPVPPNDRSNVLSVRHKGCGITAGMWARVKSGTYKGDLAQIVVVNEARKKATVKLIPRIDLRALAEKFGGGVSMKRASTSTPPRLISSRELEEFRPLIQIRRDRDTNITFDVLDGMMLKDGYLYKKIAIDSLSVWGTLPTEDELLKFEPSNNNESKDLDFLSDLYGNANRKKKQIMKNDKVGGKGECSSISNVEYSFEVHDLVFFGKKDFGVIIGMEKDDNFKIMKEGTEGPLVLTLPAKELKSASFDKKLFSAQDRNMKKISISDKVRVMDGPSKDRLGVVKRIYRGIIFLFNESEEEHNGYTCIKSQICEKVISVAETSNEQGNEAGPSGFGESPSSPNSPLSTKKPWQGRENSSFNQEDKNAMFSVGQTLRIRLGPLKGYLCRVLAIRRSDITVKLDSQHKILTVKSEHLSEVRGRSTAGGTGGDLESADPFDLLGTTDASRDWASGTTESRGWNVGAASAEGTSWPSFPATGDKLQSETGAVTDITGGLSGWAAAETRQDGGSTSVAATGAADSWGKAVESRNENIGQRSSWGGDNGGADKATWNSEPQMAKQTEDSIGGSSWGKRDGESTGSKQAEGSSWGLKADNAKPEESLDQADKNQSWGDQGGNSWKKQDGGSTWGNSEGSSWGQKADGAKPEESHDKNQSWGNQGGNSWKKQDGGSTWGNSEGSSWGQKADGAKPEESRDKNQSWSNQGGNSWKKQDGGSTWGKSEGSSWGQKADGAKPVESRDKNQSWGNQGGNSWKKQDGGSTWGNSEGSSWGQKADGAKPEESHDKNQSWGNQGGNSWKKQDGGSTWGKSEGSSWGQKADGAKPEESRDKNQSWGNQGGNSWKKQDGGSTWGKAGGSSWGQKTDDAKPEGSRDQADKNQSWANQGGNSWKKQDGGSTWGKAEGSSWGQKADDAKPEEARGQADKNQSWGNQGGNSWKKQDGGSSWGKAEGSSWGQKADNAKPEESRDQADKNQSWGNQGGNSWKKPDGGSSWNKDGGSSWGKHDDTNAQPKSDEPVHDKEVGNNWSAAKPSDGSASGWETKSKSFNTTQSSGWGNSSSCNKDAAGAERDQSDSWNVKKTSEGGSSTGWGKGNWGKSSSDDAGGNQMSAWSSKSDWGAGNDHNGSQEQVNNFSRGGGRGGSWRGGRGGRGESDRGGFGGRGGSDRGGFRGRGGRFGGRDGSDERGGYGGRGRSDRGGFRGRGRGRSDHCGGDWNNRNDSGEEKPTSWSNSSWSADGGRSNENKGNWNQGAADSGQCKGWSSGSQSKGDMDGADGDGGQRKSWNSGGGWSKPGNSGGWNQGSASGSQNNVGADGDGGQKNSWSSGGSWSKPGNNAGWNKGSASASGNNDGADGDVGQKKSWSSGGSWSNPGNNAGWNNGSASASGNNDGADGEGGQKKSWSSGGSWSNPGNNAGWNKGSGSARGNNDGADGDNGQKKSWSSGGSGSQPGSNAGWNQGSASGSGNASGAWNKPCDTAGGNTEKENNASESGRPTDSWGNAAASSWGKSKGGW